MASDDEFFVEADRRRRLASLPLLSRSPTKTGTTWRQAGSVREAMHGRPVLRHRNEPRPAAVVALVGLPQPDLERQEGFIRSQRGLQVVEAGERRRRAPRIGERQRNLSLGFLFSTLQRLELSQTGAPSLIVQRRIHEHALDRGDGLEQLPPLPDGGVLRDRRTGRDRSSASSSDRARMRSVTEKASARSSSWPVLEQASRQPVVVERPAGKERGTAVGIVLQRLSVSTVSMAASESRRRRGARLGRSSCVACAGRRFRLAFWGSWRALSLQERATPPLRPSAGRWTRRVTLQSRRRPPRHAGCRAAVASVRHWLRCSTAAGRPSVAPAKSCARAAWLLIHHQTGVRQPCPSSSDAPGQPNQLLPTIRRREQAPASSPSSRTRCIWPSPASRCLPPPWRARRGDGKSRALRQSGPRTGRDNPQEGQDRAFQPIRHPEESSRSQPVSRRRNACPRSPPDS